MVSSESGRAPDGVTGKPSRQTRVLYWLVLLSGMAALSWEVVWQVRSTLALGVSAWGAAVTLAVTMGGMCAGALLMGHALKNRAVARPIRIYGALEWVIGLSGLCLAPAFRAVAALDTHIYAAAPDQAAMTHILSIIAVLGVPALCMGATLPVLGLAARQYRTSIATLYGLNTLGAAAGTVFAAFVLIPVFGMTGVSRVIAAANITVGILAWTLGRRTPVSMEHAVEGPAPAGALGLTASVPVVMVTGFATFVLEITWFRSLTAAYQSTTEAFAIILSCVLIALGFGAHMAPILKRRGVALGLLMAVAGILILLVTPIVERFDYVNFYSASSLAMICLQWFILALYTIGFPMFFLGLALPWILDDQRSPRTWGLLYGLNALAAIAGAIGAGWVFLPLIGVTKTAWMAGSLVALTGIVLAPPRKRAVLAGFAAVALAITVLGQSGIGTSRVQGTWRGNAHKPPVRIFESYEGPNATISAVEFSSGRRLLYIDGFSAAETSAGGRLQEVNAHYMPWMGHLPMLLHPDPENALVICFGTGQTANAVRQENPRSLDIVDLNPQVFKLAHNFPRNENVLGDPRVKTTVMDGRAYIRRTTKTYDIITLEPMPPTFAGVNALYSQEFYRQAREKLGPHGVIAQWLPFHLLGPRYSASIARTFQSVYPNAILWIDKSTTGILLGSVDDGSVLESNWPGFKRPGKERDLSEAEVRKAVALNSEQLRRYGASGSIITDDNQLLAYGEAALPMRADASRDKANKDLLDSAQGKAPAPEKSERSKKEK